MHELARWNVLSLLGNEAEWEPHPFAPGLERRVLLTRRDDGAGVSIFMFRVTPGGPPLDVPEHVHDDSDDISYVLAGSADVEVEGTVHSLRAGSFLRVPRGKRHRVFNVSAEFVALNVFSPATV